MKFRLVSIAFLAFAVFASAREGIAVPDTAFHPTFLPIKAGADDRVFIKPDHEDWTYPLGTPAHFHVSIVANPFPAAGVPIKYKLGPEMREGAEIDAVVPAQGLDILAPSPELPGFVRCIVTTTLEDKPFKATATAGFSPDKITPTQVQPTDFDAYWTEQKAALAKVPPDYKLTPAPDLSTPTVEVSYLSMHNVGANGQSRFYGVLCVPRGPGPFPALLRVPGAGVRGYTGQVKLAEKGMITLEIGIHGIPVNLPPEIYEQLAAGALAGYPGFNLDDRSRYYYRRVYLGCLRANDYLTSLPKWDGKNLVVMGGSQGGQLSIVTAALDPRVTALAANYPAYSDVTGYLNGRTGGWPGFFRPDAEGKVLDPALAPKLITTSYFDTVNFARRLEVAGIYFWGYNDDICPPTSTFAAYNTITAPKELTIEVDQSHYTKPEQQEMIEAWILKQCAKKTSENIPSPIASPTPN